MDIRLIHRVKHRMGGVTGLSVTSENIYKATKPSELYILRVRNSKLKLNIQPKVTILNHDLDNFGVELLYEKDFTTQKGIDSLDIMTEQYRDDLSLALTKDTRIDDERVMRVFRYTFGLPQGVEYNCDARTKVAVVERKLRSVLRNHSVDNVVFHHVESGGERVIIDVYGITSMVIGDTLLDSKVNKLFDDIAIGKVVLK